MGLAEKLRKAREQIVEAGGYSFTLRRPTDGEIMRSKGKLMIDVMLDHLVDWSGVKEIDLIPGGCADEVPFDKEAAAEWIPDRPDLFAPLIDALMASIKAHNERLGEAEKN